MIAQRVTSIPSLQAVPAAGRSDHRRAPLIAAIERYLAANTVPFTTPGHKRGSGVDPRVRELLGAEVFEADIWLNRVDYDAALRAAEELAADAWGAERSFYLVNGSSSGNLALLLATLRPGDEVIVGRDMHQSLLMALVMVGARPVYVAPRLHPELGLGVGIHPDDVDAALDAQPAARLVALVSPTYHGVASDVAGIASVAHRRGVPVFVDEAWGPHLPFHPDLPRPALASGADAAVTSVHKLLGAMSQGSLINVQGPRISAQAVNTAVRMTQTTSPLLPILASLDAARRQMALDGRRLLDQTLSLAEEARQRLAALPGLSLLDAGRLAVADYDPTRLVIDVNGMGLTGFEVERRLRERFGVAPEMSDLSSIICLITLGDTPTTVDRLVDALTALATERTSSWKVIPPMRSIGLAIAPGEQALAPREAYFAARERVQLRAAAGRVASEFVVPYPPGIPVLAPGEIVSQEKIDYLSELACRDAHISGQSDRSVSTLLVVDDHGFDSRGGRAIGDSTPTASPLDGPFVTSRAQMLELRSR